MFEQPLSTSVYQDLTVLECIAQLNLFEQSLIKLYTTCITVVRLGQITNTVRPQSELTATLNSRIVSDSSKSVYQYVIADH